MASLKTDKHLKSKERSEGRGRLTVGPGAARNTGQIQEIPNLKAAKDENFLTTL